MKTIFIALRAGVVATGFVLFWGWVALQVRRLDRELHFLLPSWTPVVGIALLLAGGILALACVAVFVIRGSGTPAPFDPPRQFVAVGPYRYVRNPMYVGGLLALVGFGLYLRSTSVLAFSLVWPVAAHLFVVFYEEPNLRARFGEPYQTYCRQVLRWVPRPRRRHLPVPRLRDRP